jgi:hypothetical protein
MVAGRLVKHGGRLLHVDLDAVRSRAEESRSRLFAIPAADVTGSSPRRLVPRCSTPESSAVRGAAV